MTDKVFQLKWNLPARRPGAPPVGPLTQTAFVNEDDCPALFLGFFLISGQRRCCQSDPRLVPFQRAAYRLLYAPPQLPQDTPNVSGMIIDLEVLLDQVGHSLARPQRCLIAQTLGT